jgi:undecaprenyl-diphosphatase
MSLLQAIILGIVQGLTEFLPISSSGHLVLVPFLLGWEIPEEQTFLFDVLVQMGTLVAVIIYFWRELLAVVTGFLHGLVQRRPLATLQARLGWYLILATIPAGLLGLLFKEQVERAFSSPVTTALELLVTAGILLLSERLGRRSRPLEDMHWKDALWIGCAQAISIFPGISRSGATIAGGLTRHLERPAAARFSFLMSVPVMLAAGVLAGSDLLASPGLAGFLPVILAGFVTAAVVGYLSIHWLLSYLASHSLRSFAIYCVLIAAVILIVAYV